MAQFRKKPVVIEAIQWTGENYLELRQFIGPNIYEAGIISKSVTIVTLEGDMLASVGDWIIKGVKGEFYPCKPDIFEVTYSPA